LWYNDRMKKKEKNNHSNPRRPAYRAVLYVLAVVVGIAALVAYLYITSTATSTTSTVNTAVSSRDLFDELYQVGLRVDGSAGNTAVDVVYYYPALSRSLRAYTDRTQLQAGTLAELEQHSGLGLFPFMVTLQHNEAFDPSFKIESHAALKADGATIYELDRWQPLQIADASGNSIAGVLWFKQPEGAADATSFTLTFDGLPDNTKQTSFSWNASLLSAVQ